VRLDEFHREATLRIERNVRQQFRAAHAGDDVAAREPLIGLPTEERSREPPAPEPGHEVRLDVSPHHRLLAEHPLRFLDRVGVLTSPRERGTQGVREEPTVPEGHFEEHPPLFPDAERHTDGQHEHDGGDQGEPQSSRDAHPSSKGSRPAAARMPPRRPASPRRRCCVPRA
jgi:hypothetical protein